MKRLGRSQVNLLQEVLMVTDLTYAQETNAGRGLSAWLVE